MYARILVHTLSKKCTEHCDNNAISRPTFQPHRARIRKKHTYKYILVHSEKDERWLWRAPVFGDFVVHCAVPRDSKLEKGSNKVPQPGLEPQMYCYASGVNGLDFHGFSPIQCFGGKTWPKSYSCYGLLFGEIDFKNTIARAFHGGLLTKL